MTGKSAESGSRRHGTDVDRRLLLFQPHRPPDDLRDVEGGHRLLLLAVLDPVGEHGEAEGAADRYHGGARGDRLVGPHVVDPLADILLHPHPRPAGTAAETLGGRTLHLRQLQAGNGSENPPGLVVDRVISTEEAGIVIGDEPLDGFFERDSSFRDQVGDDLRVVIDFKLPAEMRVVLLQGIVPVGTGRHNLLHVVVFHHLDIGLGQGLIQVFVPTPHGRIAAASLLGPEDAEADSRRLQDLGESRGHLLPPVIE